MMSFSEQENNDTIALCMIVKNEERNLERSIKSAANLVDEIIVVDTGSTDNTVSIAKSLGAKVFNHEWDDNFSNARNVALEHVKSDWILFMDADEELDENTKDDLHDAIDYDDGVANFLYIIENYGGLRCQVAQARLFRNHKNIRYTKPVSENIYDSLSDLVMNHNKKFRVYPININHFATDNNDQSIIKFSRNMELLKKTIEDLYTPDEDKAHYYLRLIHYYRILGVDNKVILDMINQTFQLMSMSNANKQKEMIYETDSLSINMHVADFLFMIKNFDSAEHIINSALKYFPDSLNLNYLLFNVQMAKGNREEAKKIIKECKNLIDNFRYYKYEQLMLEFLKDNIEKAYKTVVG